MALDDENSLACMSTTRNAAGRWRASDPELWASKTCLDDRVSPHLIAIYLIAGASYHFLSLSAQLSVSLQLFQATACLFPFNPQRGIDRTTVCASTPVDSLVFPGIPLSLQVPRAPLPLPFEMNQSTPAPAVYIQVEAQP